MTTRKIEPGADDKVNGYIFDLPTLNYGGQPYSDDEIRNMLRVWNSSWRRTDGGRYMVPAYLSGSDYSGTLVERSNHDVWAEQFASGNDVWWYSASGGHGTFAIVVDLHAVPDDMVEDVNDFLGGLANYPLADEDHHSHMEVEAQNEAWEHTYRNDFRRALETTFEVDLDSASDTDLDECFREAQEAANVYWVNEQGDSMYIDVDAVVAKVTRKDMKRLFGVSARHA